MERENLMMTQLQDSLHLQMLQQRGPKNGEEESEDQVQEPLKGKILDTHQAKTSSGKSSYMVSSPKVASKQQAIDNARYGKIVKVQGGHIVRSISRKDRHSKVYSSKGPRDRRFRLSATTAIQFYDIQDRLGCDRPSKAIDWLIEKAKAAIEALAEPPAQQTEQELGEQSMHQLQQHSNDNPMNNVSSFSKDAATHSLQCFKGPVLADPHHLSPVNYAEEALNSASSLSDPNAMEMGWFQRLMAWNYNTGDGGEGYTFNSSPAVTLQYPFLSQN